MIGILSSIPFPLDTGWGDEFVKGLGDKALVKSNAVYENLGYAAKKLRDAIVLLNKDTDVSLVVTVGGNITWHAAHADATTSFISLVGGKTDNSHNPGTNKFVSAVSLESFAGNPIRLFKLFKELGTTDVKEICLLSNPKSQMAPTETSNMSDIPWLGQVKEVVIDPDTADLDKAYSEAFDDIAKKKPEVKAVIISADPWFAQTRANLVKASNTWATGTRAVCYPVQEYRDEKPKNAVIYGPKLAKAYKRLGKMAKRQYIALTVEDDFEIEPSE